MKGILLAGGVGTRLYPTTRIVNKHVLPLYDKPMFFWPLKTLVNSGVYDIAVISGPPFGNQIKELLKYFPKRKRVRFHFLIQPEPKGMPDAIIKTKSIFKGNSVMVIAGDNYYEKDFKNEVENFKKGAVSFLRKVKDPQRYGVPVFKHNKLIKIVEKPKDPPTNWAVTGPHIFDKNVFDYIKALKPSARGELEIVDLNNIYLQKNELKLIKCYDSWGDTGTFESLLRVSLLARRNENKK